MVSFRFHLVSLVAVFLALALGIGMGVTVIDKATVDLLQNQLNNVRNDVSAANQRSSQLQTQINQSNGFIDEANAYLVADRLNGVNVTLLRAQGIDTSSVDQLVQSLQTAGATVRGSLTVNSRTALSDTDDVNDLATALGVSSNDPAALRASFVARLAAVMAGSASPASLTSLVQAGFLSWAAGDGGSPLNETSFTNGRIVVASGATAGAPNDTVMTPLTKALAGAPTPRVVAVEAGTPAAGTAPEVRAVFVGPLRDDRSLRATLSTVDDLERPAGRIATVLALAQLGAGRVGNYGVASSASAVLPPLGS